MIALTSSLYLLQLASSLARRTTSTPPKSARRASLKVFLRLACPYPRVRFAREQVVPRVSGAPGLVAGYWVKLGEDKGTSIVVFESEEAARAMAEQVSPALDGSVTADSVEVGEVVAQT